MRLCCLWCSCSVLYLHLGTAADGTFVAAAVDVAKDLSVTLEDDGGVAGDGALVAATVDVASGSISFGTYYRIAFEGEGYVAVDGAEAVQVDGGMYVVGVAAGADANGVIAEQVYLFPMVLGGAGEDAGLEHARAFIVVGVLGEAAVSHLDGGQRGREAGAEDVALDAAAVDHRGYRVGHFAEAAASVVVVLDGALLQARRHLVALCCREGGEQDI